MAKIGVLIENMFEDSEYEKPAVAFKKANHELVHLGIKKGIVKGEKAGIKVKVEKAVGDVVAGDFDALFIPGGYSPDLLRSHDEVVAFVKQFAAAAVSLFGSGWIWLIDKGNDLLEISITTNAGNPLTEGKKPLLVLDVWEHAYYIDYRNRRADYLESFWKIVNWDFVMKNHSGK